MAAIVEGVQLQWEAAGKKLPWPKHFFEALTCSDWRRWVEAVRKEMDSWAENDAVTEMKSELMVPGAPLIPLGELYSLKRDGTSFARSRSVICFTKEGILSTRGQRR
jgi:hypothetical protein